MLPVFSRFRAAFNFRGTSTPRNKIDISTKARPPDQACIIRSIRRIKRRRKKRGEMYRERERERERGFSPVCRFTINFSFAEWNLYGCKKRSRKRIYACIVFTSGILLCDRAHKEGEFVKRTMMAQNGCSMGLGFFVSCSLPLFVRILREDARSGDLLILTRSILTKRVISTWFDQSNLIQFNLDFDC